MTNDNRPLSDEERTAALRTKARLVTDLAYQQYLLHHAQRQQNSMQFSVKMLSALIVNFVIKEMHSSINLLLDSLSFLIFKFFLTPEAFIDSANG